MKRKILLVLFFVLLVTMLCAKSYHATNYYSMIKVQDSGDLNITETFTYKFQGGPFTWVKRKIPDKYTDGLDLIGAAYIIDGVRKELDISYDGKGDLRVRWDFGPIQDVEIDFELRYIAFKACYAKEDGQIVRWRPLPSDHDFKIDRIQVDMFLPSGVTDLDILPSGRKSVKAGKAGNHIWWEAVNFGEDKSFVCKVLLPAGSLNLQQPQWQINREKISAYSTIFMIFGIISVILIIALIVLLIIYDSRLKKQYTPDFVPDDLMKMHPGLVAKIVNGFDGSPVPIAAMFFKLVKQGNVVINKTGKKKYEYELTDKIPDDEFDLIFFRELEEKLAKGKNKVKKLFESLEKFKKKFNKLAIAWHEENGYASIEGRSQQNKFTWYIIINVFFLVASLITGVIMMDRGSVLFLFITFILFYLLIYLILIASKTYTYTDEGFHLKYAWKLWAKELRKEIKEKRLPPEKTDFDLMFPYVMTTGVSDEYMKYFKKAGIDIKDSVLIKSFDSYEDFHVFIVWYIATANASGASGAAVAGGVSGGGGSASAG